MNHRHAHTARLPGRIVGELNPQSQLSYSSCAGSFCNRRVKLVCPDLKRPSQSSFQSLHSTPGPHKATPEVKYTAGYFCADQKQGYACIPFAVGVLLVVLKMLSFFLFSHILTDFIWYSIIVALLCAGIAIIVLTNIRPSILRWIRSGKYGEWALIKNSDKQAENAETRVF